MEDFVELAFEGASTGVDHYEKVYDPLKEKAKKLPNPVKKLRRGQIGRDQYDDDDGSYDSDDEYRSPRRTNTDRGGGRRQRDSRGGGGYVEESYERRSGRAKSTGRDGGRGLRRDGRSKSQLIRHLKQYHRLISHRPPEGVLFRLRILPFATSSSSQIPRRTSSRSTRHWRWRCGH